MKQKICLHGVDIKHQAQLLGLVKKLLPPCTVKYKVKEKYFSDNDMYKCRMARFTPKINGTDYSVVCAWGVLLVSDKPVQVADIVLEFDGRSGEAVTAMQRILAKLLSGKQRFVLDEPDLLRRIDLQRGCYCLDKLNDYDAENAATSLSCHIPWQLYGINKLWEQVLVTSGSQRPLWRQLRVKLRRLRSFLALVKPLLPETEALEWQQKIKAKATAMAGVREFDVMLLTCSRLRMRQSGNDEENTETAAKRQENLPSGNERMQTVSNLQRLLEQLRKQELQKSLQGLKLNLLTLELAQLLLFLQVQAAQSKEQRWDLTGFFRKRLGGWAEKIQLLPQKYSDISDREQLHKIRIKLKRFRYALQSVPELSASPRLLRSLKYLQDMLGILHDDYVNERYMENLAANHQEIPELRYEIALLRGWEQAKADAAMEQLAAQWEEFSRLLAAWQEEL